MASCDDAVSAIYSASVVDNATVCCFFYTLPSGNLKTYPVVDFLSCVSPGQSASEYHTIGESLLWNSS